MVDLITGELDTTSPAVFDPVSPDGDPGKFLIAGRVARVIHHYDGWYVPINLDWFKGGFEPPEIQRVSFHWYVFAIPLRPPWSRPHYFICDYLQIRDWVLEFTAPLGRDHRDHKLWRADLRAFVDDVDESSGYFRWGDEAIGTAPIPDRVFQLDNVTTIGDPVAAASGLHVGTYGKGGESTAHKRLKLFVAQHPVQVGLEPTARPSVEYQFRTGDRVDVMFENHRPHRTVVEVEVSGEANVVVGIHQAIKYRSLAEVDAAYELLSPRVHPMVVAYEVDYPQAVGLAERYGVALIGLDPSNALAIGA